MGKNHSCQMVNPLCRSVRQGHNGSRWLCQKGFTIVELLVVIGTIGIIIAITVPQFAAMQRRARVRAGASEITQDFRHVRERALSKGQSITVSRFDAHHYSVMDPDGNVTNYRLGTTTGGSLRFGVSTSYAGGVPPEANAGSAPADGFDFLPNGVLNFDNRGGANRGVVYITDGREDYAIGVNNLGKVKVYKYESGVWN